MELPRSSTSGASSGGGAKNRRRMRWLPQFRLRTLLLAIVLTATTLAAMRYWDETAGRQRRLLATLDARYGNPPWVWVGYVETDDWERLEEPDDHGFWRHTVSDIRTLEFFSVDIDSHLLGEIAALGTVRRLKIDSCDFRDEDVDPIISTMTALCDLEIDMTPSDEFVRRLAAMPNLRRLKVETRNLSAASKQLVDEVNQRKLMK